MAHGDAMTAASPVHEFIWCLFIALHSSDASTLANLLTVWVEFIRIGSIQLIEALIFKVNTFVQRSRPLTHPIGAVNWTPDTASSK